MTKDEALKIAMRALTDAAMEILDPTDYEKNMQSEVLRSIHTAIQAIKKARANA
jgi:hypothetical protein